MNLLACNMRPNFASGMPSRNVSQKKQFHHASSPSLENMIPNNNSPLRNSDKHFQNPNIFNHSPSEKSIPISYKHSDHSVDKVQQKNTMNCCTLILEEPKKSDSYPMLIEESSISPVETICQRSSSAPANMVVYKNTSDDEMSCSDSDDDSFIVFETTAGPSTTRKPMPESPIIAFIDDEEMSSEDDEDCTDSVDFHQTNHNRERQSSLCESEDSFILFDDGDHSEDLDEKISCTNDTFIVFGEEDSEDSSDKVKKTDNGKKVSFAEGPELCTVHLMVKWSFAYQKARKGIWEQFARDNARFKYRADLFGMKLNKFLHPEHRRKVYEERFKDIQE